MEALADSLRKATTTDWPRLQQRALQPLAQPHVRARVREFLEYWRSHAPEASAECVSLALLAAGRVEEHHHHVQRLELVWTGPDSQVIPLRRTDQALLQLVNDAQHSLQIVSFAVYRAETIAQALVRAAQRGVSIAIYLETPNASQGRIDFDTIGALGQEVVQCAQIYVWPLEMRPQRYDGRHGSLHAKIALADGQTMLVSSANLTEYAMTLNMEMGLLVQGGPLPAQVERHLAQLVEQGIFEPA
jgi:phosphatidylserine/phosphatidylglycerophosphate/cardiolipin synthase-like enzyme